MSQESQVTEVDLPVSLPDGQVIGKARVIEGEGEDAVLIELESKDPIVAAFIKNQLVGLSIFYIPAEVPNDVSVVPIHREPDCHLTSGCKYQEVHKHGFGCDRACTECEGQCHKSCPAHDSHYNGG